MGSHRDHWCLTSRCHDDTTSRRYDVTSFSDTQWSNLRFIGLFLQNALVEYIDVCTDTNEVYFYSIINAGADLDFFPVYLFIGWLDVQYKVIIMVCFHLRCQRFVFLFYLASGYKLRGINLIYEKWRLAHVLVNSLSLREPHY